MKDFLVKAFQNHFALGAFNIDNLEILKGVAFAAQKLNSPVIVEVSPGELDYWKMPNFASLVDNVRREFGIPIFSNLDHAADLDIIKNSLDFGLSMVHFDGSKLPLEENILKTKQVVSWARSKNILVEGEADHIPMSNEQLAMTNPETAKRFVAETGVDIFAVSIGNKHGVGENEKLDLDLLRKIREALPNTFFSLHGGSGLASEDVKEAIKLGIVKVNVNTELRIAFKNNLDLGMNELAWYKITQKAIAEVQKVVEGKIKLFGLVEKT
ncbi:class II fructose-bisphosphate aldolase [Candidatus Gottesmanbacteria bacterium]|nr:class II fructose-bisphosphate aldolase [Candidatus Gottesmanbacteria bacterium]